jgi:hypothetical protein
MFDEVRRHALGDVRPGWTEKMVVLFGQHHEVDGAAGPVQGVRHLHGGRQRGVGVRRSVNEQELALQAIGEGDAAGLGVPLGVFAPMPSASVANAANVKAF